MATVYRAGSTNQAIFLQRLAPEAVPLAKVTINYRNRALLFTSVTKSSSDWIRDGYMWFTVLSTIINLVFTVKQELSLLKVVLCRNVAELKVVAAPAMRE